MRTRQLGVSMMMVLATAGAAWGAPASAAPPPSTLAPAPAPPPPAPTATGARVATGQAPVVGGNAAGARERALDEAMRQAVDMALVDLADAPTRAAQAKAIKAIETRARGLVPRYRTLEEGETNGVYTVRIEAEVDEVALRRKIDRWTSPSPAAPAPPGTPSVLVAADQMGTSASFLPILTGALSSTKVRVRVGTGQDGTSDGIAAQDAARASLGAAALISALVTDEGAVRGTGLVATSCHASARLIAAPSGAVLGERTATARVFTDRTDTGAKSCFAPLAHDLGDQLAAALTAALGAATGDLKIVTLDADVVEPGVVSALLKSVRSVGAVSAAELQRVGGGHAEIRVRTRSAAGPLAAALSRDADALIMLSDVQTSADAIHLRARLRAPVSPPAGSGP